MIRFSDIQRKEWFIPAVVGAASFVIGAGVGYILRSRIILEEPEPEDGLMSFDFSVTTEQAGAILRRELNAVVIEEIPRIFAAISPHTEHVVQPPGEVVSIFQTSEVDRWDWEEELAARESKDIYIITLDEFNEHGTEYRQTTLTYYKGDNVLCDDKDIPIYGYENTVGELRFGHGSSDPKVVYVRNKKLRGEYEIVLHEGHYQIEVLGQEIEDQMLDDDVRHSAVRHFRE